ncbi:MAG: hypothetical protein PUK21_06345 [Peptostreptococcaceae bacterium]|nr:hypothetical protein [Peptostreptococcaceae bacterium]MDY5739248.1 hypothetical protein [Anaerovoracaceae bacterium]
MFSKRKNQKQNKEKRKETTKPDISYLDSLDLMPVVDFDKSLGYMIMKDGTILDCVHIISRDLENMDENGRTIDILAWQKLYSTYEGDLKIVSLYFPVDTKEQSNFFRYKLKHTKNPIYRELIEEEIEKCKAIHEQFLNREFFMFFYAKNNIDYQEKYIKIMGLNRNMRNIVEEVSNEKKKKLLSLLANKNLNF